MQSKQQFCSLISRIISRAATAALAMAIVFALTVVLTQSGQAQTYTVLHDFTGGADGAVPFAGLTMDRAGNLYGTAGGDGAGGFGTVYKLQNKGSGWVFSPLYSFAGGGDGATPFAGVVFGPDGSLYGTTGNGGGNNAGTVFDLKPYPSACKTALCPWTETVLYRFTGGSNGANPGYGDLVFDETGNIYGTTYQSVYELARSNGGWTLNVIHNFGGGNDGSDAILSGVVFDANGNLYGTTIEGGSYGNGTVYQLLPSGSGWTERVLHSFSGDDGTFPYGGVILDQSGKLYGTTITGGANDGGTVFELIPTNGGWTFNVIYSFVGLGSTSGPGGNLAMDSAGNLYGATIRLGTGGLGNIFKLTRSDGGWVYTDLYDFTNYRDGANPSGGLILDPNGNLYGTTMSGGGGNCGQNGCGVVFELTP